jgi:hypothetical protein
VLDVLDLLSVPWGSFKALIINAATDGFEWLIQLFVDVDIFGGFNKLANA